MCEQGCVHACIREHACVWMDAYMDVCMYTQVCAANTHNKQSLFPSPIQSATATTAAASVPPGELSIEGVEAGDPSSVASTCREPPQSPGLLLLAAGGAQGDGSTDESTSSGGGSLEGEARL